MENLIHAQRRVFQQLIRTRPLQQSFRQLHQSSQQTFRTRTIVTRQFTAPRFAQRSSSRPFANAFRNPVRTSRRCYSTATSEENLSFSQRMKKLSREYGWSALGVYLALSALDFPFCFLAVRLLGTDRIGHWEHVIVSYVKGLALWPVQGNTEEHVEGTAHDAEATIKRPLEEVREGQQRILEEDDTYVVTDHGYKEAEKANRGSNASIATQLALAYAIHKSFIFLRVPLTAAVTPKVVKTLRGWGWNIGKMPKRKGTGSQTGVNTKGSGVKPDD